MTVRQARPEDRAAIVCYVVKLNEQHQAFNPKRFARFDNHERQLSDLIEYELTNPRARIFALEDEKRIVGYAFIKLEDASLIDISAECAWLHNIYIDETARGNGGGKLLLNAAKDGAIELGSTTLMLQVATQNPSAKRIFENFGFEPTMTEMMLDLSHAKTA